MVAYIANQFNDGGPFMWVILVVFAAACAVTLERLIYYFVICRGDSSRLVAGIAKALNANDIAGARTIIAKRRTPLFVLLRTAVEGFASGLSTDDIADDVEQKAIKELPKLARRLNYLSLFANIATLLGLLGTITGLQTSFGSLADVDASRKATLLASGISEAMNTTAFGLVVAIPCMVVYTLLANKQQAITKDLDEGVARLISYFDKKKKSAG